jgi:hypothetical protein
MRNDSPFHRMTAPRALSRRDFLWHTGGGLGGVALASMLGRDAFALADDALTPAMPAIAPKAKRVVARAPMTVAMLAMPPSRSALTSCTAPKACEAIPQQKKAISDCQSTGWARF